MKKKTKNVLLNHKKFAEIIEESGLTQEAFAEEIGITDRYLRNLKTKNKNISVSLAYNISIESGYSIESLITIESEPS